MNIDTLKQHLINALAQSLHNQDGKVASYIPELANAPTEKTGIALTLCEGTTLSAGDCNEYYFTLQSTAKLVLLIGLLEEFGEEQVFNWIGVEPTGKSFAAIDYADRYTHLPSNPMINAGAIALTSRIPGDTEKAKLDWLDKWMAILFNAPLKINHKIYTSELETADGNRSIAYSMRNKKVIEGDIDLILNVYTALCSFEANIVQASYLPMLLAHHGIAPNGSQTIKEKTARSVVSIMATCGMYNESGMYLLRTGMPAKSGVSGLILSAAIGRAGIAVFSPRLTPCGGSVRGQMMLEALAEKLGWHFASLECLDEA